MGGAWESERDLAVGVMEKMGWRLVFRRVRIGPGKGTAFGMLDGRPAFCLPGGPPSNEMGFLQMALPGLLRRGGLREAPFMFLEARLAEPVRGRGEGWRQIVHGRLSQGPDSELLVQPVRLESRLFEMAQEACLIHVTENRSFETGEPVPVQVLDARQCFSPESMTG
jgi:molybdopterin molybdotransferase